MTEQRHLSPSVLFTYQDSAGRTRIGFVENTADHGGTDVTYFMREWRDGTADALSVLSGPRFKLAKCLHTRALSIAEEVDLLA